MEELGHHHRLSGMFSQIILPIITPQSVCEQSSSSLQWLVHVGGETGVGGVGVILIAVEGGRRMV
jgi:hypothetical protein